MDAADIADKAIENLDDDLNPIEENKKDEPVSDPKDDPKSDPKDDKENDDDKEEGFTADDFNEENQEAPKADVPVEAPKADTSGLTDEQSYILDNLPTISTRIKTAEGVREYQVKSYTQLPGWPEVEFASPGEQNQFLMNINLQEGRANSLKTAFGQQQQGKQSAEFERIENEGIRSDIADLQRDGVIPKFKVPVDDPKFDDDPTAQTITETIEFMQDRNKKYLDDYNTKGKPYKHLGFAEAYAIKSSSSSKKDDDQKAEDTDRKSKADKVAGNQGQTPPKMKKATVTRGITTNDILNKYENEEW